MKKISLFLFLFFFISGIGFSQAPPVEEEIIISEEFVQEDEEYLYEDEYEDDEYDDEEYIPPATPPREERGELYFDKRELDSSFKDKYKGDKFDYYREPPKPKKYREPMFSIPPGLVQVLSYIVVGFIILLIIYQILKNSGGMTFGRDNRRIKVDSKEITEEDKEDIQNNDFGELIKRAKEKQDFRKAVRYYYLWVLQSLSDKKLIKWNKDKTDYDYFLELGDNPIKEDFHKNTYVYDHVWYGNFKLSGNEFEMAESIFQKTLNKLK